MSQEAQEKEVLAQGPKESLAQEIDWPAINTGCYAPTDTWESKIIHAFLDATTEDIWRWDLFPEGKIYTKNDAGEFIEIRIKKLHRDLWTRDYDYVAGVSGQDNDEQE